MNNIFICLNFVLIFALLREHYSSLAEELLTDHAGLFLAHKLHD